MDLFYCCYLLGRDEKLIGAHNTIVFSRDGTEVYFRNDDKETARFVLISGMNDFFTNKNYIIDL